VMVRYEDERTEVRRWFEVLHHTARRRNRAGLRVAGYSTA